MGKRALVGSNMPRSFDELPKIPNECRPEGCAGCPFGGVKVGSRGPEDSPFVIVGESPGSSELLRGYPFVGDSGELIEHCLEQVGFGPEDPQPLILNAIQCYPRGDKLQTLPGAVQACHKRLEAEIAKYPRKVILALGNGAMWSMTQNYGLKITNERGKLYPTPLAELGCVVTFHPAYLMRNGSEYHKWRLDIDYTVSLLKGVDPKFGKWAPPMWGEINTRDEYEALLERIKDAKWIAGDIETGGPNGAGLHFQKGYILELVVTTDLSNGRYVDIIPGSVLWENEDLTHQLLGHPAKWIWQNGKFDIKFFRYEGIHEARVDHDLMLASYTMNENKGHDLDSIAWDWIGAPSHKHVVDDWFKMQRIAKKNRDYAKIPVEIRRPYAAYDVTKTYKAFFSVYEAVCADSHCSKLYHKILIPASEFLTQVEMKGLTLDPEMVNKNLTILLEQLEIPEQKIQEWARQHLGTTINVGSWQQLDRLLYGAMKLGITGSGTNEDALIKIQRRHDHPIINQLMRWRKVKKAYSTYVQNALGWPGLDNRVHVTYKLHGTSTGRLSSGDPTNLQNWPRDPNIRGQFVAAPGKILVECDLNQAELRCLALMSGDPTLLDIYTKNEVSIHHITSVALFGEGYTDDQKMRAKAVNFGIVYGRTAPSLAEEFDISIHEADEYIHAWLARFPVAARFIEECRMAPRRQRNLITNFGRKKRWGVVSYDNGRNLENEAANFPHQSSAHDITLLSGIECQPVIRRLWGAEFVNEIHDALYFEVDNDPAIYGPCTAYVQSVMQRVPLDWGLTRVPFLAEAKVGTRWGGLKNAKDAKIEDPILLSEFMKEFKPTDEHKQEAISLLQTYNHKEHN